MTIDVAPVGTAFRRDQRPRVVNDFYCEPAWAVQALLNAEPFEGEVYDPACGSGNILKVCRAAGLDAWGTDLVERGPDRSSPLVDFTDDVPEAARGSVDNIICNPPFALAERFIENALLRSRRRVAMLVRLAFLEGQKRRLMFERTPLSRVLVFSRRVSMPPGGADIKATGGSIAFCWLVWRHGHEGAPTLGWLA